jgi:hypothetical protein
MNYGSKFQHLSARIEWTIASLLITVISHIALNLEKLQDITISSITQGTIRKTN